MNGSPHILLGVSGGIAAYKAVSLLRLLRDAGCTVDVIQTAASREFVGVSTFAALSGRDVLTDAPEPATQGFPHLDAARQADVLIIAPATAATISRCAQGHSDDLLSSTYLGFTGRVIIAPAMNVAMWEHPATQRNIQQLQADGVEIVMPESGQLACGDTGAGRLADPQVIAAAVLAAPERDLVGVQALVTAGGTREPIDGVRSITNRSSGRMGVAIARDMQRRGATVQLITTVSVDRTVTEGMTPIAVVERASELAAAVQAHASAADVVVMAAAVSDFTVRTDSTKSDPSYKLDRSSGEITLVLTPTADIIGGLATERARQGGSTPLLVGFAAESGADGVERARAKRRRKGIDIIVHNDIARSDIGFDVDHNDVTIIDDAGETSTGRRSKPQIAGLVVDRIAHHLAARRLPGAVLP